MSYAYNNHRDYQLDHRNRHAAQVEQNKYQQAAHQQLREINRVNGEYLRGGGANFDPMQRSWQNLQASEAAQPHGEEMNKAHNAQMQAMQNYIANEQNQMNDRMADMSENQISSKNNSDEMAASLKAQEIAAAERMNNQNANALNAMGQSLLGGSKVESPQFKTPNTQLLDSQGKRIGGTYFR